MEIHVTAILLQMLNFGIVVAALTYLLLKPVRKILDERSQRIADGQAAAEAAVSEKNKIAELKEDAKRKAQQEAKAVLSEARKDADTRREELLADVKKEVEAARSKMLKALEAEKQKALAEMEAQFSEAVLTVAQSVIGEELDAKKHSKLIDKALKEIASSK